MTPPVGPVVRLGYCFAVLVFTDVILWEWGPMKPEVCQVMYIQAGMEMPGSLPGWDSPSLLPHHGLCTVH